MWNIEYRYIAEWLDSLSSDAVAMIFASLELLQEQGPNLGRPLVDTLANATVKNLKELRPVSPKDSEIRILFAFDPARNAILLLGGDKSKGKNAKARWSAWYKKAIPAAEAIYKMHLRRMEEE